MLRQRAETPEKIAGIEATKKFLVSSYGEINHEMLFVAHLGLSKRCLRVTAYHGTESSVMFPFQEILRDVLRFDSKALIIAHNHLSDDANPSREDLKTTRSLVNLLKPLGVLVLDHIIVTKNDTKSFHAIGLL